MGIGDVVSSVMRTFLNTENTMHIKTFFSNGGPSAAAATAAPAADERGRRMPHTSA